MDNTKVVYSLQLPIKSCTGVVTAFKLMLVNGLEDYLKQFVAPFPADWPMQFFMRQLVYNTASVSLPITYCLQECHPSYWSTAYFLKFPKVCFTQLPQDFCRSLLLTLWHQGKASKETKTMTSICTP